jgi:hypothetical protein
MRESQEGVGKAEGLTLPVRWQAELASVMQSQVKITCIQRRDSDDSPDV